MKCPKQRPRDKPQLAFPIADQLPGCQIQQFAGQLSLTAATPAAFCPSRLSDRSQRTTSNCRRLGVGKGNAIDRRDHSVRRPKCTAANPIAPNAANTTPHGSGTVIVNVLFIVAESPAVSVKLC